MTNRSNRATASAVHSVLTAEDLQISIFGDLLAVFPPWSTDPTTKQNDLVSVARTCRAFTKVALDILYRNVSLQDLLQVWNARGILRRVRTSSNNFEEIIFNRAPNPSEYRRMMYYSHRVRILRVRWQWWAIGGPNISYGTNFFPTLIEAMTNRSTTRAELFPQLESLTWNGGGEVELVGCEAIIQSSPRLKAFTYEEYRGEPHASPDSWPTLIRTLASAQSLERVKLDSDDPTLGPIGPGTRLGLALAYLITKPSVKEIELPDEVVSSTVVVFSFASARQLERLTLVVTRTGFMGEGPKMPRNASLDRLSYLAGSLDGMKLILGGQFVFRALTTINTGDGEPSFTWSFAREFFNLVGNVCPVVETLRITLHRTRDPIDQGPHFVLAPLRACTRMQTFQLHVIVMDGPIIHVPQDFNPTDSDWKYLISEWPDLHLMSYHFSGHPEGGENYRRLDPRPRATVKTLMEFSRSCRQLIILNVPLTVTSHDTDAAAQDSAIRPFGSSMSSIRFLNYSIEDGSVEGAAMLLLRLTRDNVAIYWGTWTYPDSMEEDGLDMRNERNWRAVQNFIDFARKARAMGRTSSG